MADSEQAGLVTGSNFSQDVFDIDRVRSLIALMNDHDINEIDLRQGDRRLRLRRGAEFAPATFSAPTAAAPVADASSGASSPVELPSDDGNITLIKSPMVGTFYAKPNPNAEPYVKIGDHVSADTTVCIIEAMKVFNEIPAEIQGRIVAVLAEDGEPVDHNKPLFKVDTSG